jgi:tRNA pseudouridine38-40 synthase
LEGRQEPGDAKDESAGADPLAEPLRTVKLIVAYDGTAFRGWQRQASERTIQATLEATLATIIGEMVTVHGSGRTDAGVHALRQVAHFTTRSRLDAPAIRRALNARLPADVAIVAADDAEAGFHARFAARRKTYAYRFVHGDHVDPFRRHHAHSLFHRPDVAAMREAARRLVGRHDFRSFATEADSVADTVRTLYALRVRERKRDIAVIASGNGFLQHMVRSLAGLLLEVGRGKLSPADAERILHARDRRAAPAALPARGLFLVRVDYAARAARDEAVVDSRRPVPSDSNGSQSNDTFPGGPETRR